MEEEKENNLKPEKINAEKNNEIEDVFSGVDQKTISDQVEAERPVENLDSGIKNSIKDTTNSDQNFSSDSEISSSPNSAKTEKVMPKNKIVFYAILFLIVLLGAFAIWALLF